MLYWTYIYRDPKDNVIRYVGKGINERPYDHLMKSCRTRISSMLKKRVREGYDPRPILISAESHEQCVEMEMLLIAMIGRLDLGTGPLFNLTDGGEGTTGRIRSPESLAKQSQNKKTFYEDQAARAKTAEATKSSWGTSRPRSNPMPLLRKPCTVDGIKIYGSVTELIQELGQGKKGLRSPTFSYVITEPVL